MGSSCSSPKNNPSTPRRDGFEQTGRSSPDGAPQSSGTIQPALESESDRNHVSNSSSNKAVSLSQSQEVSQNQEAGNVSQNREDNKSKEEEERNKESKEEAVNTNSNLQEQAPPLVRQQTNYISPTPNRKIGVPAIFNLPSETQQLLRGVLCDASVESKEINLLHIADVYDSQAEQDALQERVYPELRMRCAELGYELNITDVSRGVSDHAIYNHALNTTRKYAINKALGADSPFVALVFLNDKYGNQCPLEVPAADFEAVLEKASEDEKELLKKWFHKATAKAVPVYLLKRVKTVIPGYEGNGPEHRKAVEDLITTQQNLVRIFKAHELKEEFLKSDLEEEIDMILEENNSLEGVMWLHRAFMKVPEEDCTSSMVPFFNLDNGNIDSDARNKLENIKYQLRNKLEPCNIMEETLEWSQNGQKSKTYMKYINNVCKKVQNSVWSVLTKLIEARNEQRMKVGHPGISRALHNELVAQNSFRKSKRGYHGSDKVLNDICHYLTHGHCPELKAEGVRPLVVHGPAGWGKTRLATTLAHSATTWEEGTPVVVFRCARVSNGSVSLSQVLSSVAEQICVVSGVHPMHGHKDVACDNHLTSVLGTVPDNVTLAVILDGLDNLLQSEKDLSWIPETLPNGTRLVLLLNSESTALNLVKKKLADAKSIYPLPKWTASEIYGLLASPEMSSSAAALPEKSSISKSQSPLGVTLVAHMYYHSLISGENKVQFSNLQQILDKYFDALNEIFTLEVVGRVLGYLCRSKNGMSHSEILDLMSCDEQILQTHFKYEEPNVRRAPAGLWMTLEMYLDPVLEEVNHHGTIVFGIRNEQVLKTIRDKYNKYMANIPNCIIDHFEERWAKGKKMIYLSPEEGVEIPKDRFQKQQPNKFGNFINTRKLEELPFQYGSLEKRDKLCNKYLFNSDWLQAKLVGCGVYSVLDDINQVTQNGKQSNSVVVMHDFLKQNIFFLQQNGHEFYTRLSLCYDKKLIKLGDSDSDKSMKQLVEKAKKQAPPQLTPVKNISLQPDSTPKASVAGLSKIFRVKNDKNHVVSIDTNAGKVIVWNINSQEAVRTLTGVDRPRNVKMINNSRAVILCNRELKIYELETGEFVTKLKGVLNLKMPFYEIPDKEHVILLSRNRMYVNIVNFSSGVTVSTFKAGEDRFMNSLLVSANGEKCVCGDEVQKPFPLLVWDLKDRKLIHDMRLAGHEFVTRISCITDEGHYVACVCKELDAPIPNFICVYDLESGVLFKKWKGEHNTTSVAISSGKNVLISGHENGDVIIWDLVGGTQKFLLAGHSGAVDQLRLSGDGSRCVSWDSSGLDTSVRLWHIVKGTCLGVFTADEPISCCEISEDGAAVLVGLPSYDGLITLVPDGAQLTSTSEYGDASRHGMTYDLSKAG